MTKKLADTVFSVPYPLMLVCSDTYSDEAPSMINSEEELREFIKDYVYQNDSSDGDVLEEYRAFPFTISKDLKLNLGDEIKIEIEKKLCFKRAE